MTTIDPVRLPKAVEFGATYGPKFKTLVTPLRGGLENRNRVWKNVRGEGDIAPGIQNDADLTTVIDFFYARNGRHRAFWYYDNVDNQAVNVELISSAVGGEEDIQMEKLYSSGGETYRRKIVVPLDDAFFDIRVNDSSVPYVFGSLGVVTISPLSPSDRVNVDFNFNNAIRFDTDWLPIVQGTHKRRFVRSLPVVEVLK